MDSDPNAKIAWSQEQLNLFWLKISMQAWNLKVHMHVIMVQYCNIQGVEPKASKPSFNLLGKRIMTNQNFNILARVHNIWATLYYF